MKLCKREGEELGRTGGNEKENTHRSIYIACKYKLLGVEVIAAGTNIEPIQNKHSKINGKASNP